MARPARDRVDRILAEWRFLALPPAAAVGFLSSAAGHTDLARAPSVESLRLAVPGHRYGH